MTDKIVLGVTDARFSRVDQDEYEKVLGDLRKMNMLAITETFVSPQGEGRYMGMLSNFIRSAYCNLRCSFCDTKYSWRCPEMLLGVDEVVEMIAKEGVRHVVITGGEPSLQFEQWIKVILKLPDYFFTVETNGYRWQDWAHFSVLADNLHIVISPKNRFMMTGEPADDMSFMGDFCTEKVYIEPMLNLDRMSLKFVVGDVAYLDVIRQFLENYAPDFRRNVFLQFETHGGEEPVELMREVVEVLKNDDSILRRVRILPRLHVMLYGGERGR